MDPSLLIAFGFNSFDSQRLSYKFLHSKNININSQPQTKNASVRWVPIMVIQLTSNY